MRADTEQLEQARAALQHAREAVTKGQDAARLRLFKWRAEWQEVMEDRALEARSAHAAGLPITEISRCMGIARSTVYADLADADEPQQVTR